MSPNFGRLDATDDTGFSSLLIFPPDLTHLVDPKIQWKQEKSD